MQRNDIHTVQRIVDTQVFGARGEWEKHEVGGLCTFVKPIQVNDPELKARIAQKFDELGFVPMFFREHGREFVALEGMKQHHGYQSVEDAFTTQILARAT